MSFPSLRIEAPTMLAFLVAQMVKALPAMQETWVLIPRWEIPWTEEPGGLQSMGWKRVRHDQGDAHTHMHTCTCAHTRVHTRPTV